jgi:HAD superfamily hydrolase (TIGR01509 family)
MPLTGIIWDFDGVLVDSEGYHIRTEIETAQRFGIPLTPAITEEYLGVRLEEYFVDVVRRFNPRVDVDEMVHAHRRTLRRYYSRIIPLMPHCTETLLMLKGSYRMGIATSREKELADIALDRFRLEPFFDAIVYGEDVAAGKPDPGAFLQAARRLGIRPQDAVVVEDSSSGFAAARKGGFHLIAFRGGHNRMLDFSVADAVVEDLAEIPERIRKMY